MATGPRLDIRAAERVAATPAPHDIEPADLIEAGRAPRTFRTLKEVADAIVERRRATASVRRKPRRVLPPSSSASAEAKR